MTAGGGPRLLLVDGDPDARAAAAQALGTAFGPARITQIGDRDGLEAALAGDAPDAVVTEHELGWSSGQAVLEAVHARWPGCPVVMFTASGTDEVAVRALRAGLADYVRKGPQELARLTRAVEEAIASARERRRARALEADREALLARERAAREAAEAALRAKDEFLTTVSHELRAPLAAIVGWAQLLRTRLSDDPTALRGLGVILRNVRSQTRMVEELLDMSRVVSGRLEIRPRTFDPVPTVANVVEMLRPEAESKQITLDARLAPEAAPLFADPDRLEQIVWNLLSNAVKFTPAGGHVTIDLGGDADEVRLAVADTGEGIGADFLPHVFEPFRQYDSSRRRRHGGLGLGLAIVHHLVEAHGGTAAVESEGPGRGATFRVILPRSPRPAAATATGAAGAAAAPSATTEEGERAATRVGDDAATGARPAASPAQPARPLAGVSVIVVDDDPDTRAVLLAAFLHAGADTRAAADPEAALAAVAQRPADVVVSDIAMPEGGGYALLHQLRARASAGSLPAATLAVTSYPGTEDRQRALDAGFDEYLRKPYEVAQLIAMVRRLADARRQSGSG